MPNKRKSFKILILSLISDFTSWIFKSKILDSKLQHKDDQIKSLCKLILKIFKCALSMSRGS